MGIRSTHREPATTMTSFTVHCPHCQTGFPVDPDKVPEGGVRARCTSCEGIFDVDVPSDLGAHAAGAGAAVAAAAAVVAAPPVGMQRVPEDPHQGLRPRHDGPLKLGQIPAHRTFAGRVDRQPGTRGEGADQAIADERRVPIAIRDPEPLEAALQRREARRRFVGAKGDAATGAIGSSRGQTVHVETPELVVAFEQDPVEEQLGADVGHGPGGSPTDPRGFQGLAGHRAELQERRRVVEDVVGLVVEGDPTGHRRVVDGADPGPGHAEEVRQHRPEDEGRVGAVPTGHRDVADEVHPLSIGSRSPRSTASASVRWVTSGSVANQFRCRRAKCRVAFDAVRRASSRAISPRTWGSSWR